MFRHQPKHDHAIGHCERIGVAKIELVLPVTAFVIERVHVPAKRIDVVDHRLKKLIGLNGRLQIITAGSKIRGPLLKLKGQALVVGDIVTVLNALHMAARSI